MIFHNIHVNSFTFPLLVLYLFITHPSFFFIFPQVVRIPFKFINHVLQANESFLNGSNFPSFQNLCIHSGPSLGKMSKKLTEKRKFCFCCSQCWPRVDLEQVTNHYDCLEKVSVQFLPTGINWKGGTLDMSLFILDLGQIIVQFHIPTAAISYLV